MKNRKSVEICDGRIQIDKIHQRVSEWSALDSGSGNDDPRTALAGLKLTQLFVHGTHLFWLSQTNRSAAQG